MHTQKKILSSDDKLRLNEVKSTIEYLSQKYRLTFSEIVRLLSEKETLIPVSIFTSKLSILETIVKYLRENNFNFHQIGELIGRDERNVWHIAHTAVKKYPQPFTPEDSQFFIPVSIIHKRKYSALESVTRFLKDEFNLPYHEIATILNRDQRTIWAVYNRSKKKDGTK